MVEGRTQRGRPKLKWKDGVMEDAKKLGEINWRNVTKKRDSLHKLRWRPWLKRGCCANDDDDDDDELQIRNHNFLYVRNADLHRDLKMEMVTAEIRRFARKHEERLLHHDNVDAIRLLDNCELQRRIKRTKPFQLISRTLTPTIRQCNTPTQQPIVSGKRTHVASALITVNTGPMQRKHTNWTGWTDGRRMQQVNLAT